MFPKIFSIGDFFLPTYGVLVTLGFLAGLWIAGKLAKRQGLDPQMVTDLGIYVALILRHENGGIQTVHEKLARSSQGGSLAAGSSRILSSSWHVPKKPRRSVLLLSLRLPHLTR